VVLERQDGRRHQDRYRGSLGKLLLITWWLAIGIAIRWKWELPDEYK
jgi:hypothetical protein